MRQIYNQWNSNFIETKVIFDTLSSLFANDPLITKEYKGLNSAFVGASEEN